MNNCNRQVDNKSIFDYPVNECKIATTSYYYTTQLENILFLPRGIFSALCSYILEAESRQGRRIAECIGKVNR